MVTFRAKKDGYFVGMMAIVILIITLSYFLPLFFDGSATLRDKGAVTLLYVLTVGFVLWCSFSVQYIFYEKHLFVKGGPFRSRISYEEITKVAPTRDIFTGYRILSAREALEISYRSGLLGSVKISPEEPEQFLKELKRRAPHVRL